MIGSRSLRAGRPDGLRPDRPVRAIRLDEAERLVRLAARAPSVHNTQPWQFSVRDGVLEVRADWSRHLPGTDPDGRQLVVSCGAALFCLRLGVRLLGHAPQVELVGDDCDRRLLARVGLGPPAPADAELAALVNAVARRRTIRTGLVGTGLPAGLVTAVRTAAAKERAVLLVLSDGRSRRAVVELVRAAERAQQSSVEVVRELAAWTSRTPADADGLPPGSWPKVLAESDDQMVGRDFGVRAVRPRPARSPSGPAPGGAAAPVAAALLTRGDTVQDWLEAGQALQRVLLTAAAVGVHASLHSQLFGLLGLRTVLRGQLTGDAEPQMLLQLGRPAVPSHGPVTPRRPVSELLEAGPGSGIATTTSFVVPADGDR